MIQWEGELGRRRGKIRKGKEEQGKKEGKMGKKVFVINGG